MSQLLEISNAGGRAVVMDAEFDPLDADGRPINGVDAVGNFGSERRQMTIWPGESIDVVRFTGRDVQVEDLRVTVKSVIPVSDPLAPEYVEAIAVDDSGKEVVPGEAVAFVLENPNDVPATVGLICLIWDNPPPERSQQAKVVLPITTSVAIPASGEATVKPETADSDVLRKHTLTNAQSCKTYPVPRSARSSESISPDPSQLG
ncbi:hypothetical protein WBG06_24635 [Nocardioides sp. CCNWLW239]|uniref:hypothetical protein n=1 Tax=Nocardioides sp. CCNWLW239 TaxID=3128902 RepID=UPI003017ACCC